MFNLLIALLGTYIFYKHGLGYMLQARIMEKNRAEKVGYAMFMVAGTIIGEFFGISLAYHYAPPLYGLQILSGTLSSILLGEAFYHYNKRITRKIPTVQERKNY